VAYYALASQKGGSEVKKWIAVALTVMLVSAAFAQVGVGGKLFGQSPAALFQYRTDNFAVEITGMYSTSSTEGETTTGIGVVAAGKYYFSLNETLQPYIGGGILYIGASAEGISLGLMGLDAFAGIEFAFPQLPIKAFASLDMVAIQIMGVTISNMSYQLGVRYDF